MAKQFRLKNTEIGSSTTIEKGLSKIANENSNN